MAVSSKNKRFNWIQLFLFCLPAFVLQVTAKERWVLHIRDEFASKEIISMTLDSVGNRWFGTKQGLVRMSPTENWDIFNPKSTSGALPGDTIHCMLVDQYGDVWIGTDKGLVKYSNGDFESFTVESTRGGLPHNSVLSIAMDINSNKWMGTHNGFAQLANSIWTTYSGSKISGNINDPRIMAIETGEGKDIWLGTVQGVLKFDGINYKIYNQSNTSGELPNNFISDIKYKNKDSLWVATAEGLALMSGGVWTFFTSPRDKQIPGVMAYKLHLGKDGSIWAGFKGGATGLIKGEWITYTKTTTSAGLPSKRVFSIMVGDQNNVFFGTREGLAEMIRF